MSDIQQYLIEYAKHKDQARKVAADTASKIHSKQTPLLVVIESVGAYINDEDASLRVRSLAYLADVLEQLPNRSLSLQQRTLLTDFILSRIESDNEGVAPCSKALTALEQMGKWDPETARKIILVLIESGEPLKQYKLQGDRYAVLQLVDLLFARYRTALNELADGDYDFIARFVAYFEGEKDPRNLMMVFSIVSVPMTEWNLGPSTQDLFDLIFNYFPITFKPPPGDPFGITAQDLKDRLKACISSTSDFAPYAFPALLDKLDSTSMNTKRDVLQAITSCILEYEPRTITLYSVTLWDALKFEILNVQEEDLAVSALEGLGAIAQQLALASEGALNAYLKPMVKECNEHFEDAPTKQSEAAGKILNSIAKTTPQVCDSVVRGVMPSLLTLFQASDSMTRRRGLVEVLIRLLQAIVHVSSQWQVRDEDGIIISDSADSHAFRPFSQDVIELLLEVVISAPKTEISFRLYSLEALEYLLTVRKLLSEADTGRILTACTDIIINEADSSKDEIKSAAVKTIIAGAQQFPKSAVERALPALLAELPDCPEPGIFTYEPAVEVLAKLSVEPSLANTIIIRLKNKLDSAKREGAPQTYILALTAALLYVFTYGSPASEDGHVKIGYLNDLIIAWLDEATGFGDAGSPLQSEVSVDILSRICNLILRVQNVHTQNQTFALLDRYFESVGALQTTPESEAQSKTGSALRLIPSLYFHAAFRKEIYQDGPPQSILKAVMEIASDDGNTAAIHAYALRHTSLLVNKFVPGPALEKTLSEIRPQLLAAAQNLSTRDVELVFAVLKGSIVQGKTNPFSSQLLNKMVGLCSSDVVGLTAAYSLGRIFAPDELLNKQNHGNVSGLFKQRTYAQCCKFVQEGFQAASPSTRKNHLIALSEMLRHLPYDIVRPSIDAITPLLLQTLDLDGAAHDSTKAGALHTIEAILLYDPAGLNEHVSSIISRLLGRTDPAANLEKVRAGALRCLKVVPTQLRREVVIPFRRHVIKSLLAGLDDTRRSVRAEAVRCRSAWLDLDNDDEED